MKTMLYFQVAVINN